MGRIFWGAIQHLLTLGVSRSGEVGDIMVGGSKRQSRVSYYEMSSLCSLREVRIFNYFKKF